MNEKLQGFYLYGELRLTKDEGEYMTTFILPSDSTDSDRVSMRADSEYAKKVRATEVGTQVAFHLTSPRIATSKRTGNRYLAGLQVLGFFAE